MARDKGFVYIFARMKLTKVFYISDRLSQDVRQAAALQWMEASDWAGGARESNRQVGSQECQVIVCTEADAENTPPFLSSYLTEVQD